MSAAPGSGSGTGYSRISKGLPVPWNTAIRAVSAMENLLWWPVSYRNGRAGLARVEVVDLFDQRAQLQRLRDVVGDVELATRRLESFQRDEALLDEDQRERVNFGSQLFDDVGVAAADARDDLGDELFLLGREVARREVAHAPPTCERHATELVPVCWSPWRRCFPKRPIFQTDFAITMTSSLRPRKRPCWKGCASWPTATCACAARWREGVRFTSAGPTATRRGVSSPVRRCPSFSWGSAPGRPR